LKGNSLVTEILLDEYKHPQEVASIKDVSRLIVDT